MTESIRGNNKAFPNSYLQMFVHGVNNNELPICHVCRQFEVKTEGLGYLALAQHLENVHHYQTTIDVT